jgi:YVTN family beta-propeller protein
LNTVTNRFYVANAAGNGGVGTGEVLVFDATTNLPLDTIAVGAFPTGIAVNAVTNTVYVTSINSQSMSVIDGATDTVTATLISVGTNPNAVAVNPVTNKVYIADDCGGELSSGAPVQNLTVIDGATNKVTIAYLVVSASPKG